MTIEIEDYGIANNIPENQRYLAFTNTGHLKGIVVTAPTIPQVLRELATSIEVKEKFDKK